MPDPRQDPLQEGEKNAMKDIIGLTEKNWNKEVD